MKIKDRNQFPPRGWVFFQPETTWWAPDPMSNGFSAQVQNIINHRRANPRFNLATDATSVANDLEAYTCSRINNDPQWCYSDAPNLNPPIQSDEPQKKTSFVKSVVAALVRRVRQLKDGEAIGRAWLGDSLTPVDPKTADDRVIGCLNCPKHDPGNWFDHFTGEIAEAVMEIVKIKNHLELTATNESGLGSCKACGCHLASKVWIPLKHIRKNTSPKIMDELDSKCWIKTEKE